jgi:hypothetical protein
MIITTQEKRQNMINVGDTVMVGSRIGVREALGEVVAILPAIGNMVTLYRVRFDVPTNRDGRRAEINGEVAIADPQQNECWVDASLVWPDLTNSYCG